MEYELVYDVARDFFGWPIVAGSVLVFAFLIVTIYFDELIPRVVLWLFFRNDHISDMGRAFLAIIVLLLGAASAGIINENLKLRSVSKKNECTQITGVVSNFESTPRNKIFTETFILNDVKFKYDTHFMVSGFNTAAVDRGPIYEGAEIRLCYIESWEDHRKENLIIRVETASNFAD